MKLKDARSIAGSLGYPSKMPGTSYGISASACITGQKLAAVEGSVCAGCYAMKANYRYSSVQKAHAQRLAGIAEPQWVAAMVAMLNAAHAKGVHKGRKLAKVHRWHDSGDLQSRDHLARICAVARATPRLRHWLPTREGGIVRDFMRDGGAIPRNLTIRLSATMVDGAAPRAWPTTSTVHTVAAAGHICPAPKQGNNCGACRACWSRDVANVSYHVH